MRKCMLTAAAGITMNKIVECVPNFSEGRDEEKIELIVRAIASAPDVFVLDRDMDPDHNRSVITFAGRPEAVVEAAIRAASTAVELIDLNRHIGEHPRIGALDVLPFVPIRGVTMDECVALAHRAGDRIARELRIPVYYYEKAALEPARTDLADVRRGGFEALRDEITTNPDRFPDAGEAMVHPTAGAIAIAARAPLIAYNINLATQDLSIAKKIARAVRGRDGGLQNVKALGIDLKNRRQVQVSINLVDYKATPVFRVFEMVRREAERYGVMVAGSEIIGLIPQSALNACADFFLRIEDFSEDLILEHRLQKELERAGWAWVDQTEKPVEPEVFDEDESPEPGSRTLDGFANEIAESAATPDGGSVAAYAGALAAALGAMVCNLTISHRQEVKADVESVFDQLDQLGADLRLAVEEAAESRMSLEDAIALPRGTDGEKLARTFAIEEATKNAIAVPQRVAQSAFGVIELLSELSEVVNPAVLAELASGAQLALAALRGAAYNVLSLLLTINDEELNSAHRVELRDLIVRGHQMVADIEAIFLQVYPIDSIVT